MKTFQEFKKELLKDPETKAEYDRLKPEYDLIRLLIKRRLNRGMTQTDVARKLGTKQTSVSRLESGANGASLERYAHYASAVGSKLKVSLD